MKRARRTKPSPLTYPLRRWRDQITPAGKLLVAGVCLASVGAVSVDMPIYQIFCALCILLGLAEIVAVLFFPRLELSGQLPQKTVVGQPATGTVCVRNRSRWRPVLDLSVGFMELPSSVEHLNADDTVRYLPPNGTAQLSVTLLCRRRGLHQLAPLRAYSTFPFNLVRMGNRRLEVRPVLALPTFRPLSSLEIPLRSLYQPGGPAVSAKVGESLEYVGNREYVPGEPARRLDFRSWARLGRPVVREFREEYFVRLGLVVDAYVPRTERRGPSGESVRLEAAVSLAAAIADATFRSENAVDVVAAGCEVQMLRQGRDRSYLEHILEILACLEPLRDDPLPRLHAALQPHLRNLSGLVCVLLHADRQRQRFLRDALAHGCSVKVVLIQGSRPDRQATELAALLDAGGSFFRILSAEDVLAGRVEEL